MQADLRIPVRIWHKVPFLDVLIIKAMMKIQFKSLELLLWIAGLILLTRLLL